MMSQTAVKQLPELSNASTDNSDLRFEKARGRRDLVAIVAVFFLCQLLTKILAKSFGTFLLSF